MSFRRELERAEQRERRSGQSPFALRGPVGGGFFGGSSRRPALRFVNAFTTPYQVVQSDLAVTYSATPRSTGASPPAVTFGGTRTFGDQILPVPLKVTTSVGVRGVATYALYNDGGVTPTQVGQTAASVPIACLPGMTVLFPAGSYAGDETYTGTVERWGDQAVGAALDYTGTGPTGQPPLVVGINGFAAVGFAAANRLDAAALTLPQPGTTPWSLFLVVRKVTWSTGGRLIGGVTVLNACALLDNTTTPDLAQFNGVIANTSLSLPLGTFGAVGARFGASTGDYLRPGSGATVTGTSAGNTTIGTGRRIGWDGTNPPVSFDLLMLGYAPPQSEAAFRAMVTAKYTAGVQV